MKCLSCGADIQFDAATQKLKCEYCGNEFTPEDYKAKEKVATEHKDYSAMQQNGNPAEQIDAKMYTCTQCSAKILVYDETAVTFCSYCGSSQIIAPQLYKEEKPEYIIPFKITKEQCEQLYKKAVNKFIFAPDAMKEDVVISKFRGIYMPYAIYKAEHHGPQLNNGSKCVGRTGDYLIYNDYTITTDVDAEFDGMAFDLASQFLDKFSNAIAPFDFHEAIPFDSKYMSGYYADAKDVDKNMYGTDANALSAPMATKELKKDKNFRKFGCSNPVLGMNITDVKTAYYPVYFLAIKNKDKSISYAVVNGQTGKVAIEMPIDFSKYLIFSAILTIPIFFILAFLVALTPTVVTIFAFLTAVISLIFNIVQRKALKENEEYANDKALLVKKSAEQAAQGNQKLPKPKKRYNAMNILYEILAMVISILVLIAHPVSDMYYYVGAVVAIILVVLSFFELVKQYNVLTSRKLSQLNARGGDENA